ncbi:MAG: DUF4912 domain-containing protein [Thermotogae bacterium]|jgi:hypothetical protein|nr:DUF4912 domain-containing protein [Thermotogota bacterium]MCL5032886.1 DUF4912 domain-containing protein [Thermotogota bacterium]
MREEKTIRQLKKEAMLLKIKGYYNMTKSELAEVISRRRMELSKKIRELDKMEIDELRKLSKEFDLKVPWKSARSTFVKKIKALFENLKLNGELEEQKFEKNKVPSQNISSFETQKVQNVNKAPETVISLPVSYFKDKFCGLEVNPNWIHFYWDFSPKNLEIIKEHSNLVLRVYDVTYIEFNGINAHRTFEMEIDEKMKKYYVFVPQSGADYIAEIGYKENNRFVPLLRSNLVSTPPSSAKIAQMELWMDLRSKRKFTEMSPSRKVLRIEKLVGFSSMPTSGFKSGGGSFFILSGRRGS